MHPLLQRQLKRLGITPAEAPTDSAAWQALLARISQSYTESDQSRTLLERSLDVMSREMQGLYEDLQRASESELARERNKLEAVLHSLGDGLCVVDAQWNIVLVNPQAEQMFGLPLASLNGQPVYHFLSPSPEEFGHASLITDTTLPPLEQGAPYRTDDGLLLRHDGQMLPVSLAVTPVSGEGAISGAVLVFRDITDQKKLEEHRAESAARLRRIQAGLLKLATNATLYRGERAEGFPTIAEVAAQSLQVARVSIWFFTEIHEALHCAELFEISTGGHTAGTELSASSYPRYFAELATEDVIVANQAQTDLATSEFASDYLIPLGITSMLDAPIRSAGKMVGVICHEHIGPPRIWTAEEQQFATSVANTVSLVLEAADRRKAEQALRENEEKYRGLFEGSHDAIMILSHPDWKFTACNPATVALFGAQSVEQITTLGPWNVSPELQPDGKPSAIEAPKMIMTALQQGSHFFEWTHKKLDGSDFPATVLLTRITLQGQVCLQATVRNISEQKRAEMALRELSTFQKAMLDNAGHAIISYTPDGIICLFNPAAESLLGYRAEELVGKSPALFHDPDEVATRTRLFSEELGVAIKPGFDAVIEKSRRGLPNEHEWTYIRKDGTRLTVLLTVTALRNPHGDITAYLGIASDITPRKIAEQELIAAKEAAEAANIAKSRFLANMSHEIRTPMNGVLGLAALLQQTSLTPKQRRLTDTIVRSGSSLLEIINDILDFSKIETGKLELEHTDFPLRMLVDDVLELFAAPAHQKHLELIGDIADTVPDFVTGDPARLRQILVNLIGNAIKFTDRGEVIVRVSQRAEEADASILCFSVEDSGIGISPDALHKVFRPFAQADGSTTRKYGGTGLGLAIAKQLVAFMGGEIWVESQAGSGATFFFTVHLTHSHQGNSDVLFSTPALPNQRVLVVDDNPTFRLSLDRQLRNWKVASATAESGQAALRLLIQAAQDGQPYNTVLVDLEMPHMNGLDTIRAIHATLQSHAPRIILMTPIDHIDTAVDNTGLISTMLTKPIRPSEFHRVLSGQPLPPKALVPQCPAQIETLTAAHQGSILLAEDNAVNQDVTLGMLEVLGCTATAVETGRRAVDLLAAQPFSLILMDCQMPEMDGFEATRTIRQQEHGTGKRIPIVALTAHALQGDRALCLAAGMDDYLSKPFTIEQLKDILHRWLPTAALPSQSNISPDTTQSAMPPALPTAAQASESPVDQKSWDSILCLQRPGQPDLLAKVIGLYLKDSQELVDKILAAAEGRDFTSLRDASHSLKSRSATLGAWRVAELCKELETGARAQSLAEPDADRLGKQLQQTFTATCDIFELERQRRAA
jgi:PAS domain S-box-containing protein